MDDSHPPTVNSHCVIIVPCPIGLGLDLMDAVIKRFRWSRNMTVASPLYFIKLFREEIIATALNYALNGHGNFVFWPISWPLGHLNISILFLSPYFSVNLFLPQRVLNYADNIAKWVTTSICVFVPFTHPLTFHLPVTNVVIYPQL